MDLYAVTSYANFSSCYSIDNDIFNLQYIFLFVVGFTRFLRVAQVVGMGIIINYQLSPVVLERSIK